MGNEKRLRSASSHPLRYRMKLLSRFANIALLLSACSDGPNAPPALLAGRWGGDGISVIADARATTINFGCGDFATLQPIPLATDGAFSIKAFSRDPRISTPVLLQGHLRPADLELSVSYESRDGDLALFAIWIAFRPARDQQPDFRSTYCGFPVTP